MRDKQIEDLKDYKYGFSTDIESFKAPKGLNEEVIRFISNIKKEPDWLLQWRLKAFKRLFLFIVFKSPKYFAFPVFAQAFDCSIWLSAIDIIKNGSPQQSIS